MCYGSILISISLKTRETKKSINNNNLPNSLTPTYEEPQQQQPLLKSNFLKMAAEKSFKKKCKNFLEHKIRPSKIFATKNFFSGKKLYVKLLLTKKFGIIVEKIITNKIVKTILWQKNYY